MYQEAGVKATLRNVFSKNYNKKNILLYYSIFIIAYIVLLILSLKTLQESIFAQVLSGLVLVFTMIFSMGIYGVAIHNAILKRKGVFPDPYKNIGKAITISLSTLIGLFINSILLIIPIGLCGALTYKGISTGNVVIVVLSTVITIFSFFIAIIFLKYLMLNYFFRLKFKAFFEYKRAFHFLFKEKIAPMFLYPISSMLLQFVVSLMLTPILFVINILITILSSTTLFSETNSFVDLIVIFVLFASMFIFDAELSGQLGRIIFNKELEIINKKRKEKALQKQGV